MSATATQATLLERLRNGSDPLVWTQFFDRYWRLIYAWSRRLGASDDTAEEVVQEVMLSLFRSQAVLHYDPAKGRFRNWLGGVVRHHLGLRRRSGADRLSQIGQSQQPIEDVPAPAADSEGWDEAFEQALLGVLLDIVRQEVRPQDYQAFELITVGEMSGAEAAQLTGLSRNAVYLAKRRVLARLKQLGAAYRRNGELSGHLRLALEQRERGPSRERLLRQVEQTLTGVEGAS